MFQINNRTYNCPMELAIAVIGGKWKILIVVFVRQGARRYSDIYRHLEHASHKMLAEQLRELHADGVITRTVHPTVPPTVEYGLTELGEQLVPHLLGMAEWGMLFFTGDTGHARESIDAFRADRLARDARNRDANQ